MSAAADTLERGRESYGRHAWADAVAALSAADRASALEPEDLVLLATATYLIGHDDESTALFERAHHEYLGREDVQPAVRCAFWLAFFLLGGGQVERGGGWVARGRRLLEADGRDCVEQGYVLFIGGMASIFGGDVATAHATFCQADEIGERLAHPDPVTLARPRPGPGLVRFGRRRPGQAALHQVLVAV